MATTKNTTLANQLIPFAIYTDSDHVLMFYADTKMPRKGDIYKGKFADHVFKVKLDGYDQTIPMWSRYKNTETSVRKVTIDATFNKITLTSLTQFFYGLKNCKTIDITNLNTSHVRDMDFMFYNCSSLKTILGIENLNTSSVETMADIFLNCSSLTSLDLSGWDTSNVKDMSGMFSYCESLKTLNLANFVTKSTTTLEYTFFSCSSLVKLNMDRWDTSSIKNISSMFFNCTSFVVLDLSSFNTSSLEDMYGAFSNCSALKMINLTGWDISYVDDMYEVFANCTSLTTIKGIQDFCLNPDVDITDAFLNCPSLKPSCKTAIRNLQVINC